MLGSSDWESQRKKNGPTFKTNEKVNSTDKKVENLFSQSLEEQELNIPIVIFVVTHSENLL